MKKMKQLSLVAVAALLLFLVIFNWGSTTTVSKYDASFSGIFDTQTDLIGYDTSKEAFTKKAELLKNKLTYYNNLFDIYHSYQDLNNIKTINDNAGIKPVKVNQEIINLLLLAKEMADETDNQVNVAMGSVLSIWHDYRESGLSDPVNASLPSQKELDNASEHMNLNKVIIDTEAQTVYLPDPEMSLDVGSIGKGYAVQKVAEYGKSIGITNFLISVGGNVCVIGNREDGTKWRLGIQNPDMESDQEYAQKVDVSDCSVVTSGDYQRYYTVDGIKYCHIIDPDTLMPSNSFHSVTIIATDSGKADALSTAVFNMTYQEGLKLINNMPGVEAMWIMDDGSIRYSNYFENYVVE